MRSVFATYHPIINLGFFCVAIGVGMFMIHPAFLAIGTSAAVIYGIITGGKGTAKFSLCFLLPVIAFVAIFNPIVNKQGATIMFYIGDSYFTFEAAVYGLLLGLMLASILLWFSSFNKIMTSDKFVYLFGRIMPATSLIFSMVMRFVPNYKMQIQKISDAQKCIGRDVNSGTVREKARHGMKILSIMFTWALENSIDSADSMRSRGYGLKNRSTFSIYRFDRRDTAAAIYLALLTAVVLAGTVSGACHVDYYPEIIFARSTGVLPVLTYIAYGLICYFPVAVEIKEVLVWRRIRSEI